MMEVITDLYFFLFSVILISLSGVMAPGPLLAVTVAKASKSKIAGISVALGHGVVEFPLMFLIFLGITQFSTSPETQRTVDFAGGLIWLVGGVIMLYMGVQMVRALKRPSGEYGNSKHGSLIAGVIATGANPYFLMWWLTIGTALVMNAKLFGFLGFSMFAVTHWFCDFLWYTFVALMIFKSQRFWNKKVHYAISLFCIAVLLGFGAFFTFVALQQLVFALV